MLESGFVSIAPMERLSVMGLIEPLKRLPELIALRRQLYRHFIECNIDVMVGIDSPDFNLGLEKKLKTHGVVTCHYVCPSVWAWRQRRVKKIRASVDHVLALLPFEVDFLQQHGIAATFVGHPLADRIAQGLCSEATPCTNDTKNGAAPEHDTMRVCIMPGSRSSEVNALLDIFLHTALLCAAKMPELEFTIPAATPELYADIQAALQRQAFASLRSRVSLLRCFSRDEAHACIRRATVVLLASGTATLEAALLGRPMVVAYRMSGAGYAIASRLVKVEHIALPNLLLGERVVPELIQDQATPGNLSGALLELLGDAPARYRVEQKLVGLRGQLARGADHGAATAVLSLCRAATRR